jgi:hypothetical protein
VARRRTPEDRYKYNVRKQQRKLEDFAAYEIEWSGDLMLWYRLKKQDMPDDEYRACAFFQNKEYLRKPGSLSLLYAMYVRCNKELPDVTKENAFDLLSFRYKMYAKVLETGGF